MRAIQWLQDDQADVFEEVIELRDGRAPLRLRYAGVNAFLGQYLSRMRRGEPIAVAVPPHVGPGDVVDVTVAVAEEAPITLRARVLRRGPLPASELAEVQFFAGQLTDRLVWPLLERALGPRHAARILKDPAGAGRYSSSSSSSSSSPVSGGGIGVGSAAAAQPVDKRALTRAF